MQQQIVIAVDAADEDVRTPLRVDELLEALGRRRRYDPNYQPRGLTPRRPRINGKLRESFRD